MNFSPIVLGFGSTLRPSVTRVKDRSGCLTVVSRNPQCVPGIDSGNVLRSSGQVQNSLIPTIKQGFSGKYRIGAYSRNQSPDVPPDLRTRRMSCKVMARSTVLHMSYTVNS